jgi:hypothetical protein
VVVAAVLQQFYSDAPLVPLRQFGADRLRPLVPLHVPGAYTEGSNTRLRNPVEARVLAEKLVACLEDPAHRDRTFGVVLW